MERGGSAFNFLAFLLVATLFGALSGCGQSNANQIADEQADDNSHDGATTASAPDPADAAEVVREFLEAIKTGDETKSNDLLTPLARQKTSEMDMAVAPIGSDSASFTVGEVELPEDGGGELAHVVSTWTDIDEDGQPHTDEILWVLRHEDNGWRIGGMATKVFEDEAPLLLNFEDPADMRRKQQLAEAEMERRARATVAEVPEVSDDAQEVEAMAVELLPAQRQAAKSTKTARKK